MHHHHPNVMFMSIHFKTEDRERKECRRNDVIMIDESFAAMLTHNNDVSFAYYTLAVTPENFLDFLDFIILGLIAKPKIKNSLT